jgi:hypothetical protein
MKEISVLSWDDYAYATTGEKVPAPETPVMLSFNGEAVELDLSLESIAAIRGNEVIKLLFSIGTPHKPKRASSTVRGNHAGRRAYRAAQRLWLESQGIEIPKDKAGYKYSTQYDQMFDDYLASQQKSDS